MTAISNLPPAIGAYFESLAMPVESRPQLWRELLAADAEFSFAGTTHAGRDAVLAQLAQMPSRAGLRLDWQLQSTTEASAKFRAAMPPGLPGGLVAMDYELAWNDQGQITRLAPLPHHATPQNLAAPLRPGAVAPDFTLPDTNGAPVPLAAADAAAYLVIWTCNHCPWALAWHERIQHVASDFAPRGVRTLQISANDPKISPHDTIDASRARVEAGEFASPYLIDAVQKTARAWGARHTPEVFVLSADLRVIYHGAPDSSHHDETRNAAWIRDALEAALAGGKPAALPETTPIGCTIKWTLA